MGSRNRVIRGNWGYVRVLTMSGRSKEEEFRIGKEIEVIRVARVKRRLRCVY